MKGWLFLPVLLAVILSGAILASCGGDKKTGDQSTGQPAAKNETLEDLFAKGKKVEGLFYDYSMTADEMTMNGKVWLQGKKMKTEITAAGQNTITFFDGDSNTVILYNPAENSAMKIGADRGGQDTVSDTPLDYTDDIKDISMVKELEKVVYDGVKCRVVEVDDGDKTVSKMWIHADYGIPMRIESTGADGEKFVMEYKNMKIGSIAADVFKLPAGIEITDISAMMEQMQQLPGMPGG
ncbi:MAG: hypothetical protein PHY77_08315 [Desulfotomaculaceae bacterium]|nr:hypothetical protein [Desulfotomaculaceae bacterium]